MMTKNNGLAIYIHVPFCMSKCSYCSFVSICGNDKQIQEYFDCLQIQIKGESKRYSKIPITSIYIGGGTPSCVNEKYIVNTINTIKKYYNLCKNAEISIECNPCSTTLSKLTAYKNAGINRISFGVQSLNDNCLSILKRRHNAKEAIKAISLAKKVGFTNISADLLIGIPEQTLDMLLDDIITLANNQVTHISAYMLMLEECTKLYEQVCINHSLQVVCDDEAVNMYNGAYTLLKSLGYNRYEISNFCKDGYECKHNVNYWDMGEYLGFGLSAHSFVGGSRIAGFTDFDDYYNFVNSYFAGNGKNAIMPENEVLTNNQLIEEYIMLGLRQTKGVNLSELKSLGYDILNDKKTTINLLANSNIIVVDNGYIKVMPEHFGAINQIILELLP